MRLILYNSLKCHACFEHFPTLSVSRQPNGVHECSRDTVMSICKLPHGQYSYSGHINFSQDFNSFATNLPRLPSEVQILNVRRKESSVIRTFVSVEVLWKNSYMVAG
uniref:Uncharacterized protein n=1 Tax=Amphimedon queenslandica TaxID=400682 RepID=A0A1X7VGS4_AMPQE